MNNYTGNHRHCQYYYACS